MNIINDINALLAKLTEQQYAPYKELYENMKEEYDKRYDHIFGVGNNRLYLDDTIRIDLIAYLGAKDLGPAYSAIVNILHYCDDFYYFKDNYYDFACNRIYDKNNREYRLTKLLQLLITKKLKNITEEQYEDILERVKIFKLNFKKDLLDAYALNLPPKSMLTDSKGVNLSIVISRDPYDIVGMSTDRRWRSCMRLPNDNDPHDEGGQCTYHLQHDIKLGTLVAYLIEPTDKNIDKPYARIAIKPHYNIENKSVYLFSEDKVYSDNTLMSQTYKNFKSVVDEFLNEVQNDIEGVFKLPDQLYPDSETRIKTHGDLIKYIDFDEIFGFRNGKTVFKNKILSEYNPILYDIYILNNTKYPKYNSNSAMVNVTNKLIDKIIKRASYVEDNSINDVYSIYITEINKPIKEYISRIDVDLGIYSKRLVKMLDTGDVYINPEYVNVYVSEMYIKEELKDDKILINNIVTMCKNNY